MKVQAEVSIYPLRTDKLGNVIERFQDDLQSSGLTINKGSMSSTVTGGIDQMFTALKHAFTQSATDHQIVMVLKVSNACPLPALNEGSKEHE